LLVGILAEFSGQRGEKISLVDPLANLAGFVNWLPAFILAEEEEKRPEPAHLS
jgi:hypothetical protein